jgi:hypothetical protein
VIGADSDVNGTPTVIDRKNRQVTSGGTSTGVLLSHTHSGTAVTSALQDPGHAHKHIGPNRSSSLFQTYPSNFDGLNTANNPHRGTSTDDFYTANTNDFSNWGFNTDTTSSAIQWLTSPEYIVSDKAGNSPTGGSGITFNTTVTVFTSGTTSNYSNLPQYRSLYFIYKWLTA